MKKFFDKVWEVVPSIWGVIWTAIITVFSVALLITAVQWLLNVIGVM